MQVSVKEVADKITIGELAKTGGFAKYFDDIIFVHPAVGVQSYHLAFNFTENKPYTFKSEYQVKPIHGEITFACP